MKPSLLVIALIVHTLLAIDAASALADPPATIAVIPLQSERRLALYGQPVANELATALRAAGFDVVLVSDVSVVPTRAWLVVDGRLVRAGTTIAIELRLRDPERAIDVARLAATADSLAELDRATRTLGAELTAVMERERTARAAALAPPVAPPPIDRDPMRKPDAPPPPPKPPIDRRPIARITVIGRELRDHSGAALDVAALGTPAVVALAARLGYRTAPPGSGDPAITITVELLSLAAGFERDVPVGRARARVKVEDATGVLWSRVVRTDTVVGSRGDRVDTLVRLVAAQVTDVVEPRIRERLGSP